MWTYSKIIYNHRWTDNTTVNGKFYISFSKLLHETQWQSITLKTSHTLIKSCCIRSQSGMRHARSSSTNWPLTWQNNSSVESKRFCCFGGWCPIFMHIPQMKMGKDVIWWKTAGRCVQWVETVLGVSHLPTRMIQTVNPVLHIWYCPSEKHTWTGKPVCSCGAFGECVVGGFTTVHLSLLELLTMYV